MATRMALEDMIPACADIDASGFWSVECWGGATFDACIRFLNEDPWERLRTFRKLLPSSRTQMLVRGQSGPERDRRLPGLRRPERCPQRAARDRGGEAGGQARAGHHLLHRQP